MDAREERGLQIAKTSKIELTPIGWKVPSQSGHGSYIVKTEGEKYCSCPDFETRHLPCKHIHAVEFMTQYEIKPDGTTITTQAVRITYNQNWSLYNEAQTHEQEHFVRLLRDLCNTIPQPTQTFGRPKLPMSDVVFGIVTKVYSMVSGRRFMSDLKVAEDKALVSKAPSFTSIFRYLENPELTPILKSLIEQSANPLKAVETDFAVDSSGFSTNTYARWFDYKYGKGGTRQTWIKTHLMCGVKTHVVTAVEAIPNQSADAIQFPGLVSKTAKTFTINEVSADKAYSSRDNLHTVEATGGTAFIPFKRNAVDIDVANKHVDSLWSKMWHFYNFNKETFLQHYHKRSNVETTYSMIKMKFGGSVRAKTSIAQVNEVLCKILCHNICVLIQSMYELKINPSFLN